MVEYVTISVTLTVPLKKRIDIVAAKRMSSVSQIIREATNMGLEKME